MVLFFKSAKAQSAIEYLMTYGWMLLVVAIVGGAVFSLAQGQDIESIQGFDSNEIQVNEFGMTPNSLQMAVEAFGANTITLTGVKILDNSNNISIPLNQRISPGDSSILNLPHIQETDGTDTLDIELSYNSNGLENITASGSITGGIELDTSLVGYWPLREAQTNETHVLDISQSTTHGKINGDPKFTETGESLHFEGDSRITTNVSENGPLDLRESITITAWITVNDTDRQYIVSRNDGGGFSDQQYLLGTNGGNIEAVIGGDSYDSPFPQEWSNAFDEPKFVAFTWDGEEIITYGNGEQLNTHTHTEETFYRPEFAIGARSGSTSFNWNGKISEINIYDRALSPTEMEALYQNQGLVN